jgi:hypothetical protein
MIFAVATDEKSLLVFPSAEAAIAYCEGIDVQAGSWLFWDSRGIALQPEFLTQNHHGQFVVGSGAYQLIPAPSHASLSEALAGLHAIESNPHFPSLTAVATHLAAVAPVPQHGA